MIDRRIEVALRGVVGEVFEVGVVDCPGDVGAVAIDLVIARGEVVVAVAAVGESAGAFEGGIEMVAAVAGIDGGIAVEADGVVAVVGLDEPCGVDDEVVVAVAGGYSRSDREPVGCSGERL